MTADVSHIPFEYLYALDAVMPLLAKNGYKTVLCNSQELLSELNMRLESVENRAVGGASLWIEPQADDWQAQLSHFSTLITSGNTLLIIASRPLARLLPERRLWQGNPLGLQPGGIRQLKKRLPLSGFRLEAEHGIHTLLSTGINSFSTVLGKAQLPSLFDRLYFAARLTYRASGWLSSLSTVSLIEATAL
ncbi:hypothetical protein [Candidatus Chlorohelix sp.]|uniref:hypothetical protein n=1 Tax=Candidatus Chlorohelix sp. TaxID=3139201 RepID=UPI00306F8272